MGFLGAGPAQIWQAAADLRVSGNGRTALHIAAAGRHLTTVRVRDTELATVDAVITTRMATFLILTGLAGEPMHGYGLIAEVARLSDGRISLRPVTLYGALDRLVAAGLVAVEREDIVDGRLRRYYRLTEPGGEVLAAETERMRRNVEAATARLRATMPSPRLSGGRA